MYSCMGIWRSEWKRQGHQQTRDTTGQCGRSDNKRQAILVWLSLSSRHLWWTDACGRKSESVLYLLQLVRCRTGRSRIGFNTVGHSTLGGKWDVFCPSLYSSLTLEAICYSHIPIFSRCCYPFHEMAVKIRISSDRIRHICRKHRDRRDEGYARADEQWRWRCGNDRTVPQSSCYGIIRSTIWIGQLETGKNYYEYTVDISDYSVLQERSRIRRHNWVAIQSHGGFDQNVVISWHEKKG